MSSWKARLALCLILASVGGAAAAGPASASLAECPSQWICLWQDSGFVTNMQRYHDNGWQNLRAEFLRQASSIYNHTERYGQIAQGLNGEGNKFCIAPNTTADFIGRPGWNDSAKSVRLIAPPGTCSN